MRIVQPILAASSLRVDVAGVAAVDGLSFSATGQFVLVLGAARALFEAAAGLRAAERGEVHVEGAPPLQVIRQGVCASAPLDPPLPPRWTALEYVTWSARLAGQPRSVARAMATDAIARLNLAAFARTKMATMPLAARRATVLAAALATGATTILVEDPLCGLPPEADRSLARALARALADRRTAFFGARIALESPIALAADEAIVVEGSGIAVQGPPGEIAAGEHAFVLRIAGDVPAFVRAFAARGGRLLVPAPLRRSSPAHLSVDLGSVGTREVLAIASASDAVVLELRPLARAFA